MPPSPRPAGLCPLHREESAAWLDYRSPPPGISLGGGGSGNDTLRGALASRQHRAEDWARTIRTQQRLIREACAAGLGCTRSETSDVRTLTAGDDPAEGEARQVAA